MSSAPSLEELVIQANKLGEEIAGTAQSHQIQLNTIKHNISVLAEKQKRPRRWSSVVTRTVCRADCELTKVVGVFDTLSEAMAALPSWRSDTVKYEVKKFEIGATDRIEYDSD